MVAACASRRASGCGRIDVGGNRAGTQTGYTAYGYSGQNRVLVEGINTTEGTAGAGFYVDYGSFEEVFLGTIGQGAEMPTPGVQSQMLGKSGGNKFQGELYQDYETNGMIADNITGNLDPKFAYSPTNTERYPRAQQRDGEVSRQQHQRRRSDHEGQDVVVLLVSQSEDLGRPAELRRRCFGPVVRHQALESLGKVTHQINKNNKLIGYYQWGQKEQPNRLPSSTNSYTEPGLHPRAAVGQLDLQG